MPNREHQESENQSFYDKLTPYLARLKRKDGKVVLHGKPVEATEKHLRDRLAELIGMTPKSLFDRRTGLGKEQLDEPIHRRTFFALYTVLKVRPEEFLLGEKQEKEWLTTTKEDPSKFFTLTYWKNIKAAWPNKSIWEKLYVIAPGDLGKGSVFDAAYKEVAVYFMKATKHIHATELTFKGDNEVPGHFKDYETAQKKIYEAIYNFLGSKPPIGTERAPYERIYYLSPSNRLFHKNDELSIYMAFVAEASLSSLEHILHCLDNYPDLCSFSLIAAGAPYRQHVNIDNEYLLIEDYAFEHHPDSIEVDPNRLCVLNIKPYSEASQILNHKQVFRSHRTLKPLDRAKIIYHLKEAESYVDTQIKESDKAYAQTKKLREAKWEGFEFIKDRLEKRVSFYKNQLASIKSKLKMATS
ncbi:hypothetical protein CLV84_4306 [Neolewinella xylanilytica]|uniref:Uncharacterized protein n=1 Tax=Neolewinella xylanilytica TaxID=1514080 RepID=A0A2S6HZS5_9BACT|nr:hypothetical protein [Neolewinella xylanilytica]PPK83933.1 hypothetical protein CLV84_4306 [Neolewinella xylanilytica]